MAQLKLIVPGEDARTLDLGSEPLVIGRTEEADVFMAEKKASRRHLRVAPLPGGGWVAEDLGSANGTRFGDTRILRHLWKHGETLHIGDSSIELLDEAAKEGVKPSGAAPVIQLGGSLAGVSTRPVEPSSPSPASGVAAAPRDTGSSIDTGSSSDALRPREQPVSRRAAPQKSSKGAIGLVVVAVAALLGVEFFLAPMAREAQARQLERREVLELLAAADEPAEEFAARVRRFEQDHPTSSYIGELEDHLGAARRREAHHASTDGELTALAAGRRASPRATCVSSSLRSCASVPRTTALLHASSGSWGD